MRPHKWHFTALSSLFLLLFSVSIFGANYVEDDTVPTVRDRVARISVMEGDVQIKRLGSDEWETATANLPIVEGDEIATGENSRLEIQFESKKFARIYANAYVKIANLSDSGIALSLSQGSLQASLLEFNKDEYFEIDAPQTTVALLKAGSYRIDAGRDEVRVTVPGEGEARIYSTDSGFTLGSVRTAVLALSGEYAGEWNTHAVFAAMDNFDGWINDREKIVTERLAKAHYDEYYDDDIYGAEDLNANGEWIHTSDYGYVWQPYSSAISSYSNWSPYRYGQWRWVAPYGWTWVNDEPWGWATYHYGRWISYRGGWAWTPYGYYRMGRSWWSPALVLLSSSYGYISWCPLPYTYAYYNYNYHYWYNNNHHGGGHNGGGTSPTPTPAPTPTQPSIANIIRGTRVRTPPLMRGREDSVVAIRADQFGNGSRNFVRPSAQIARTTVSVLPADTTSMPTLPDKVDSAIQNARVSRPIVESRSMNTTARTGAAPRTGSEGMDTVLRSTTIRGGRTPVVPPMPTSAPNAPVPNGDRPRNTGSVSRPTMPPRTVETPGINPGFEDRRNDKPVYRPRETDTQRPSAPPVRVIPPKSEPIYRPQQERRPAPPVRSEPSRESRPSPPPTRSEPSRESRPSPPPAKSDDSKPSSIGRKG